MIIKNIKAILACDPIGVIGKEGKLPWHYSKELAHFAKTTQNSVLIMGYLTYLSLPKACIDKHRLVVFTKQAHSSTDTVLFVHSLQHFLSLFHRFDHPCYVIGGAQIIRLFLEANLITQLILTHIRLRYEGDTFFPLPLIEKWPYQKIQECNDFTIYNYFKPII